MSQNSFERKMGKWLRVIPGSLTHHPPDQQFARLWKPADFMFLHSRGWALIECKQVSKGNFPLSSWTQQQRGFCRDVLVRIGGVGAYWLLIHFKDIDQMGAVQPTVHDLEAKGSFTPNDCIPFSNLADLRRILLGDSTA